MLAVRHLRLNADRVFNFQIVFSTGCGNKSSSVLPQRTGTESVGENKKILGFIAEGEGNSYVKSSGIAADLRG
jgi:hypothetical protein